MEYDYGLQSTSRISMHLTNGVFAVWYIFHMRRLSPLTTGEVGRGAGRPPVASVVAKGRLRLFGHLATSGPSRDHSRILQTPIGRPPAG